MFLADAGQPDAVMAALRAVLDDEERGRADAFRGATDRDRFVVAHGALRMIAGQALGAPPDQLRFTRGPHGKPELTGVHVSLSHSGDRNAVAVCANRRVGVDLQRALPALDVVAFAARYFPPDEAAWVADSPERFATLWTRKEALVKARGGTLAGGLSRPVLGLDVVDGVRLADVPAPDGFHLAVAAEGAAEYRVVCQGWVMGPPPG